LPPPLLISSKQENPSLKILPQVGTDKGGSKFEQKHKGGTSSLQISQPTNDNFPYLDA
jgi:hypothetical protein